MSAYGGDAAAIGKLIWSWGEAYVITYANGLYHAERRDDGAQVHAPDPEQLGREDIMQPEIDGRVVATATERSGGWWEVTYWPRFFNRNQAITALTVTELLESSRDSNAPLVAALGQELLNGPADQAYRHGPRGQGSRHHRT